MYTSVCTMANISYKMFQNVGKQRGAKSSNKYVHGNESVRFHNVPVDTLNTFKPFLFCEKFWKTLCQGGEIFFKLTICKVKVVFEKRIEPFRCRNLLSHFPLTRRTRRAKKSDWNVTDMWLKIWLKYALHKANVISRFEITPWLCLSNLSYSDWW